MAETDKDLQRREVIFRVLDDLQGKGERINADKVARLAQMGKQTVLPYYNEWRFLDDAEKDIDTELPADLVRVLKRGLVQWKHDLGEQQRDFEETANKEIDELQEMVRQLSEERLNLKEKLNQAEFQLESVNEQVEALGSALTEQEKSNLVIGEQLKAESEKIQSLQEQLESVRQEHAESLKAQERQLDTKYDSQINHWMKVVDDERRLRTDIEQQLKREKEQQYQVEKEKNDMQYRLESKSRAHLEACEERNQLRHQNNELTGYRHLLESVMQQTGSTRENLLSDISHLQDSSQQAQNLAKSVEQAQGQLAQQQKKTKSLEHDCARLHELEKELEKERGFSEALKMSLNQTQQLLKSLPEQP